MIKMFIGWSSRPILEYASEVWDNCRQTNCNRLEKIQIEVARIVTGLSIYGSLESVLSINTSICFVHLQSLLKITPKCLCICTGDSEISLNAKNVHWMVLYQICVFGADLKFNR
jgi:hypothetical protein